MNGIIHQSLVLSNRKRRIAALLIDHVIMVFLMVSITFVALGPDFINEDDPGRMTGVMLWVMIPGFILYFSKDSINGISAGRWIMGIMVREDQDANSVPSFGKLFLRNIFLVIWPVELIVLAASSDKKRIGDKVSKTVVLKNPDKPKRLARIMVLVGIALVIFLCAYLLAGSAMKNSDAYKVAVKHIEADKEILEETGGIVGYRMMPAGNINIRNRYGEARLQIKVLGKKKDVTVSATLEKEPGGEWKLIEMD